MRYTFPDRVLDGIDELVRGIRGWSKSDHSQYLTLACAHSNNSLALFNGSLLSIIEIEGYMGQYIPDQFVELRDQWMRFMQTNANDRTNKGFDLFWSYEYDPEGMEESMHKAREPMRKAARRRGMDVDDIVDEEAQVYGQRCASEKQYLLVVSHIDSLPSAEHKAARTETMNKIRGSMKGRGAMLANVGIPALGVVHEQHVSKLTNFLSTAGYGYSFRRLSVYEALWEVRHSLMPSTTSKGWKARLTLRDCAFRSTEEVPVSVMKTDTGGPKSDLTFMLPPKLAKQLMPEDVVDLGKYVVVGDRTYAPIFASELAVDPEPIEFLLRGVYRHRIPVRMVYCLGANSDQANYWNRVFAGNFNWMSASNRQITTANKAMQKYKEAGGALFAYGISVATWAPTDVVYNESGAPSYRVSHIDERSRDLETLLQQWGGQQLTTTHGCAVEALMSATPGYMIPPACPLAPQIDSDVVTQLPIMRPAKLWPAETGIWFRTGDGSLMPHQPMSSRQNTMITFFLGGMGFGKSNCLSDHINFFANHPTADTMPYIRGMDFGASSSGVIDIVRHSLPANRKHEAIFEFFVNDGSLIKNMLDTPLGCMYPLADHETFLLNWLMTLADDVVSSMDGVSTIQSIFRNALRKAYQRKDPRVAGSEPNVFQRAVSERVVLEVIDRAGIEVADYAYWWDIVEALFDYGVREKDDQAIFAAKVAQRHAVPLLFDVTVACSNLADQYKSAPKVDGIPLVDALCNSLKNATDLFPCFSGRTNRDISESRVCVFDMSTVFQRGDGPGASWRRSVFFMTAFRLLTEDLFVSKRETGDEISHRYEELGLKDWMLRWHDKYLEQQDLIMKVFWGDELHRIGTVAGAFSTLESMGLEGRKYRVGLMLGTQNPEHLPKALLLEYSSAFIFGASQSAEKARLIAKLFDLTPDECKSVQDITKPNAEKGAEVFCIHKVDTRIQKVKLNFNLGPIKRWAYATEGTERALRGILYSRGPSTTWARRVLASQVPDLNKEIKRRYERLEAAGRDGVSESEVIDEIAMELLGQARA
jgi:intracellular multiplication protein IcmB